MSILMQEFCYYRNGRAGQMLACLTQLLLRFVRVCEAWLLVKQEPRKKQTVQPWNRWVDYGSTCVSVYLLLCCYLYLFLDLLYVYSLRYVSTHYCPFSSFQCCNFCLQSYWTMRRYIYQSYRLVVTSLV